MSVILVIEDDAAVREEILRILRFEEYEALGAASGVEGLELAERHRPDCILCDLLMPELDGFETLSRLRSRPDTALIPVIFLTARSTREDIRTGMDMGADDYVTKPFTAEELLAAVSGRLARRKLQEVERERKLRELRDSITVALPHEFRTPLTVVLGFAELLERGAAEMPPGEVRDIARDIHQAARRLEHLVENFLFYADLEISASHGDGAREAPEAGAVSRIIADAARRAADDAGRESDLVVEVEPAEVAMSEAALERVIREIASNAFKFSRAGTPVEARAAVDGEAGELVVQVSDRGRGMSAEEIASIGAFMQFRRRFHEQQGSGLGLVIARRLVELNRGRFEIVSEPGRSVIVTLHLPLS